MLSSVLDKLSQKNVCKRACVCSRYAPAFVGQNPLEIIDLSKTPD